MKNIYITKFLSLFIILVLISLGLESYYFSKGYNTSIKLTQGWQYSLNNKASVPLTLPANVDTIFQKGDIIDLYITLPTIDLECPYITTTLYLQCLEAYLDDTLIYSYGLDLLNGPYSSIGSGIFSIPLPPNYSGKTLHLRYTSTFDHVNNFIASIYLRSETGVFAFVNNHPFTVIITFLLLLIGIMALPVGIIFTTYHPRFASIKYISYFAILCAVWMFCNNKCIQLFTSNLIFIHSLEYLTLYLLPIPIWCFIKAHVHTPKLTKIINLCLALTSLFFVITTFCHLFIIKDYFEFITIYHIMVVINIIIIICILCYHFHHTQKLYTKGLVIGLFYFFVAALCLLIEFYFNHFNFSLIFDLSLLAFVTIILLSAIKEFSNYRNDYHQSPDFKTIAYYDELTHLPNQLMCKKELLILNKQLPSIHFAFCTFSLYNLKAINNTQGYTAGDSQLITLSKILVDFFDQLGFVGRFSCSTFVIFLTYQSESSLLEILQDFKVYINTYNENQHHQPLLIECNYIVCHQPYNNIWELYKKAKDTAYLISD